jgi:hypothetical protein
MLNVSYQVVVSFVVSAVLTIVAVVYAYLSDSMPVGCLTETDRAIIADFQRFKTKLMESSPVLFVGLCWLSFSTLVLRRKPADARVQSAKRTREQREEAITRFILTLSDQQLVVGLAILIAAVTNQCTLSTAEFSIAFALAWFSSTTHLATLDSLQHYFHLNPTIRTWRVVGMLLLLLFFLYCFAIVLYLTGRVYGNIPVQCLFADAIPPDLIAPFEFSYGAAGLFIAFVFILIAYMTRISQSYTFSPNGFREVGLLYAKLKLALLYRATGVPRQLYTAALDEWRYILSEAAREHWAERQNSLLVKFLKSKSELTDGSTLLSQLLVSRTVMSISWNVYHCSLLTAAPSLAFMLAYAFTQLVYVRWLDVALEDEQSMGFGQITPLFLLVLPILAAAEIYYGMILCYYHVILTLTRGRVH